MKLNIVVTNKIIFKGSIYSEKEIISIDIYMNPKKRLMLYCKNCQQSTNSLHPKLYNQHGIIHSRCVQCMSDKVNSFEQGSGIINYLLNSKMLPELHSFDEGDDGKIQRANFLGPFTKLDKRLKNYNEKEGTYDEVLTKPINKLDEAALKHDLAYGKHTDIDNRNIADRDLMDEAIEIFHDPKATNVQKSNALLVMAIMEYKMKHGSGINGGAIHPSLLTGLLSLLTSGAIAGGAYGLSKIGKGADPVENPLLSLTHLLPLLELL